MGLKKIIIKNLKVKTSYNIHSKLISNWLTYQYGKLIWQGNQFGHEEWLWNDNVYELISFNKLMRLVEVVYDLNNKREVI